jgi:SulP family sulfate permease
MNAINRIQLKLLLPKLSAGVVIGTINIIIEISLAALIFSGSLTIFLSNGIGMMIFSGIIFMIVIGLTSSLRGVLAGPQDSPAAILGLIAAAIARSMPANSSPETTFATIAAAIALTSIATGIFFLVLGRFKSGNLVRFIPYPVVGGFLAGTGWLLVKGAFGTMIDTSSTSVLSGYFSPQMLVVWLPGLIVALVILWITRRNNSILTIPVTMLISVAFFYAYLAVAHISVTAATIHGWLLGPFPGSALWKPLTLNMLGLANWRLILGQSYQVGTILIVSVISLLLNAGGIELATHKDLDFNRELTSAGIANLAVGLIGGAAGYHYVGDSILAHKMSGLSRTTSLIGAFIGVLVLLLGASFLSFIPKFLVGGLLLFLGLSFLTEWVYDAWFKLPRVDYVLVLVILGIVGAFGFLQGVAVGIGIALVLFVVKYSQVNVIKHILTGASYHSTVDRPLAQRQMLRTMGDMITILQLQNFIFFGTAQVLLDTFRARIQDQSLPKVRYFVLDFRRVTGFDSSAVSIFIRMHQLAEAAGIQLVFTHLSNEMQHLLDRGGIYAGDGRSFHIFATLDYGVEWCEYQILDKEKVSFSNQEALLEQFAFAFPSNEQLDCFMQYLEKLEVEAGYYLIHQGDPAGEMFFIESGSAFAQFELNDGRSIRLRTMLGGTVVGEVAIYQENVRTASVVTAQPTTLYRLTTEAIQRMEEKDPQIANRLHHLIAHLMADRLAENNNTLVAVLD